MALRIPMFLPTYVPKYVHDDNLDYIHNTYVGIKITYATYLRT